MLVLDKIPDKKLNRIIVFSAIGAVVLLTVLRLPPILTAKPSKRAGEIISLPLPKSASDVHFTDRANFYGGDYYISAKLDHDDFLDLTKSLGMTNQPDLFQKVPSALIATNLDWWTVAPSNDTNTVAAERPSEFSWIISRYENGRIYFHRHMKKIYNK